MIKAVYKWDTTLTHMITLPYSYDGEYNLNFGGQNGRNGGYGESGGNGGNSPNVQAYIEPFIVDKDTLLHVVAITANDQHSVYIHARNGRLTVHCTGGNGGYGGKGWSGSSGANADSKRSATGGGTGGAGGSGGEGGDGGEVSILTDSLGLNYIQHIRVLNEGGHGGEGGPGGGGGSGGKTKNANGYISRAPGGSPGRGGESRGNGKNGAIPEVTVLKSQKLQNFLHKGIFYHITYSPN